MRHTFIDKLRSLDCRKNIAEEIVGHEKERVHAAYGGYKIKTLSEWVGRVEYTEIDLGALRQPYSTWPRPEPAR